MNNVWISLNKHLWAYVNTETKEILCEIYRETTDDCAGMGVWRVKNWNKAYLTEKSAKTFVEEKGVLWAA